MSSAAVLDRAQAIVAAARRGEPLAGCPYHDADLVRAYTLTAATEVIEALAHRLEQVEADARAAA